VASLPAYSFRRNPQPRIAAPRDTQKTSSNAIRQDVAGRSGILRSGRIWSATLWLGAAFALAFLGFALGAYLDSPLLGLVGADIVFLLGVSVATSGPASPRGAAS